MLPGRNNIVTIWVMGKRIIVWLSLLIFLPVLAFGWLTPPAQAFTEEQRLINEAWRIVNQAYVDETFHNQDWRQVRLRQLRRPLNNREATYGAIQEMLSSLEDPFTRLLKPAQYRSLQTTTVGELTGVGLQISLDAATGFLEVITPLAGSPAAQAGLQPRDRILQINGTSTKDLTLDQAAEQMRGPAGTSVMLTIQRFSQQEAAPPFEIELEREHIALNSVEAELKVEGEGFMIGYVRLNQFNANATDEMIQALVNLEDQGAEAYILDLRSNPGGLLQAGVEIAQLWLEEGPIVYTVDRRGSIGSFNANGTALSADPLVVLVNQGTASASEILAGALQDSHRAQLVGETTFGKGSIQSLYNLSDGSGLAVTIAKYETPNHRDINKIGIVPDHIVALDTLIRRDQVATEADPQYQFAQKLLTSDTVVAGAA